MIRLNNIWYAGLIWLLSSLGAQAFAGVTCPEGFERSPSGLFCFAKNLGTATSLTKSIGTDGKCPPGSEQPPGVNFCVLDTLTVNAAGELLILEARTSRFCPEGFQRAPNKKLCIASNLTVERQGSGVVLRGPTLDCPVGFYKPVGSTICVAGNATARTLPVPTGPVCPPGFHRPPGVAICIAKNIIFSTTAVNLVAPTGTCPEGWHRPPGVLWCIPDFEKAPDASSFNPKFSDTIILPCPVGTIETWFDVPVYDANGLFVVDYVTTRFCIPENLPPAG
jgi:hypothetical protein